MIGLLTSAPAAALLRWLGYCGASIIAGAVAYAVMRGPVDGDRAVRLARVVRWSAIAVGACGIGRLLQQAIVFAPTPAESAGMIPVILGTSWGYAWLAQLAAALFFATMPRVVTPGPRFPIEAGLAALVVVVAPAFQGHAIASQELTTLAVVADALHLVAAAVWMGTLLVLVTVAFPALGAGDARALVVAFSPWALTGAATLGATGVFASWLHVRTVPLLWGSSYGRLLLLKLVLVVGVLALGAINWRRLTPRLVDAAGGRQLASSARRELAIAAVVFLVTAFLVATPLPGE